jgi:CBS domain containing-hemolysin-like protein
MLHIVHKKLIITGVIFLLSWLIGTYLIHRFEAGYPIGDSYFNAFYFTIITTATIGFGDLVPMTVAGKILTMCYAIFYVPLFLYVMTVLFQSSLNRVRLKDELLEQEIHHVEKDVEVILSEKWKTDKRRRLIAKK